MLLAILTAAATCTDPVSYGARPDDGQNDSLAIQQAIDAAVTTTGRVCLGKGVFNLERVKRSKQYGSLMITRGPIEIYGAGAQTILRMTGPGKRDDWRAIEVRGARTVHLHDFAIDGLDAYDTAEQTHLIDVAMGSRDVMINRMTLGPMRLPDEPPGKGIGGDCIRLLGGKPADFVTDVSITNSTFSECDRSGVSLQRGLRRIYIAHNTIQNTGDQAIDFEPTGPSDIQDVVMIDLTIKHHPNAQGSDAIAISGNGKRITQRVTLADSRIEGGGIRIIDATNVHILRNTIDFGARGKLPVISILRRGQNIHVFNNRLVRPSGAAPGPILAGSHLAGMAARGVVLEHNEIRQETAAPIVRMTSINGVTVRHNKVVYAGNDPKVPFMNVNAVLGDVDDISVTDNQIEGESSALLVVGSRDHKVRRVAVGGNQAPQLLLSVQCRGKADGFVDISSDPDGERISACKGVTLLPIRPIRSR